MSKRRRLVVALAAGAVLVGFGVASFVRSRTSPTLPAPMSAAPSSSAREEPGSASVVGLSPFAPVPTATPPASTGAPVLDEPALMQRLRTLQTTDPEGAVALAGEGNRLYGMSPDAPERTSILIHALASLGRGSEARAEAESMVNDYEDSRWVREVERFTGAHRHRNVRVSEDGAIDFY